LSEGDAVTKKEKEVLELLERDARTTAAQLATMTDMPEADVEAIIRKAEGQGVILKYKTVINWEKAGEEWVWALIEVKISPQREVGFDATAERIARFPQARSVYLVSGTYDLAVLVTGETMHEVAAFVGEKLAPLEGVQGTVTHFILKRFKEDGELMQGGEGIQRLPISL
jgi:DNA-binding Lrp family transcriptional regulator